MSADEGFLLLYPVDSQFHCQVLTVKSASTRANPFTNDTIKKHTLISELLTPCTKNKYFHVILNLKDQGDRQFSDHIQCRIKN